MSKFINVGSFAINSEQIEAVSHIKSDIKKSLSGSSMLEKYFYVFMIHSKPYKIYEDDQDALEKERQQLLNHLNS